jgi:glycosyltransferase involved in cell wall biosynthesis
MHKLEWLPGLKKAKRIIWRSIGQNVAKQEALLFELKKDLPQLEIVRYSPAEQRILGYIGHNAIIRFYKDELEFNGWVGNIDKGMTIAQSMAHPGRQRELNFDIFEELASKVPISLFGIGNEDSKYNAGQLSYEAMKGNLRQFRFYFYTGTMPAPYTLGFMEALMTGIPIVAIGKGLAYDSFYKQNTYEVADILQHGKNGFIADDATSLAKHCQLLLDNAQIARKIGANGRATAIKLFGRETIKNQWGAYL